MSNWDGSFLELHTRVGLPAEVGKRRYALFQMPKAAAASSFLAHIPDEGRLDGITVGGGRDGTRKDLEPP